MVEQYSSATEARIESAERMIKGAAKKVAGLVAGREHLVDAGDADLAEGEALRHYSKEQADIDVARSAAQRDAALYGSESRS